MKRAATRQARLEAPATTSGLPHLLSAYDREANAAEFGRILALSDGVFAIALTLLVLDLALPVASSSAALGAALAATQANFLAFAISVVVVGILYGMHHRLFSLFQKLDGGLLRLNILYLGLVVLTPFFQRVLGEYAHEGLAYAVFAGVLGTISLIDAVMLWHAQRAGLLRSPLRGHHARLERYRGMLPVMVFFTSIPLAFLVGGWTVLLWLTIVPADMYLAQLELRAPQRGLA